MNIHTFQNEAFEFSYCEDPLVLTRKAQSAMFDMLFKWQSLGHREPTLAQTKYGVPCLFVRFDCVVRDDRVEFYEIQDTSSWAGYTGLLNKEFLAARDAFVREKWPPFKVLDDKAAPRDDKLWVEETTLDEALAGSEAILFRYWKLMYNLSYQQFRILMHKSIGPTTTHNDKWYGIPLGLWNYVRADETPDLSHLPWDTSFVIKPLKQWGSHSVMIWMPEDRKGRATRTQITNTLKTHGVMLLQKLIRPMPMTLNGSSYNAILRPYFAYDTIKKQWESLGGVWTARPAPNMRIHGSSDAISGPLILEK